MSVSRLVIVQNQELFAKCEYVAATIWLVRYKNIGYSCRQNTIPGDSLTID